MNRITKIVLICALCVLCLCLTYAYIQNTSEDDFALKQYNWTYEDVHYEIEIELFQQELDYFNALNFVRRPASDDRGIGWNIIDFVKSVPTINVEYDSSVTQIAYLLMREYGHIPHNAFANQGFVDFVLAFIQLNFDYDSDINLYTSLDYIAFPIETIILGAGDCEDLAILFTSIISACGYDAGIAVYRNHAASIVKIDSFFESDQDGLVLCSYSRDEASQYYMCETTSDFVQRSGYADVNLTGDLQDCSLYYL